MNMSVARGCTMRTGYGLAPLIMLLTAAACTPTTNAGGGSTQFLAEVPEGVRAEAAPFQDLTAVQLRPEDGCYWYRHTGPVETTFLPLRTVEGRPICTRAPEEVAAGA